MALKHKKYSGVEKTSPAGIFDSRLRAGQATGLTRGTAKGSPGSTRSVTVNKRKYVTKQYSETYR